MKKVQKSLSLVLACVLLLPQNALCSWSWWQSIVDSPVKAITESLDAEKFKRFLPLAVFAAFVGVVYWMSKKQKSTDEITTVNEKREDVAADSSIRPAYTLEQYPVYSQFAADGGEGASCGYHTLLRAMQIVQAKSKETSAADEEQLKEDLMSSVLIPIYFGSIESDWRKKVIIERKKKALKNALHEKFLSVLQDGKDSKTVELYKSALGYLENIIMGLVDDVVAGNERYEFTDSAIKQYIRDGLEKLKNVENTDLINSLETSIIIQEHVNVPLTKQVIAGGESTIKPADMLKEISKKPDPEKRFEGDWLDDGELELLWNYEKEKRSSLIPGDIVCDVKTIPNFNLIGQEGFDELTPFIEEKVKNVWKNQPAFQVFALGTMRQTGETTGTAGHWYALVMDKDEKENYKYSITDSAGIDRTKDKNALKVINIIERFIKKDAQ